jgi:molybdopterin-guanine dinucleotide biosynthesis protein A
MRDATAIVMCGGRQSRWNGPGLKQLAPMFDRPIVWRTFDAVGKAVVACSHEQFEAIAKGYDGKTPLVHCPTTPDPWCRGMLQTRKHWSDRNVCLLGDVYFCDETLRMLSSARADGLHVIGRKSVSRYTGGTPETFALSWHAEHSDKLADACDKALEHAVHYPDGGSGYDHKGCPLATPWQPYRILADLPIDQYAFESRIWVNADNWTDDVDDHRRYLIFKRRCEQQLPLSHFTGRAMGLWPSAGGDE